MSRLGMADLGVATLNDMRDNAAMIASLDRSIPVIADADTGYGGMCLRIFFKIMCTQMQTFIETTAHSLQDPFR